MWSCKLRCGYKEECNAPFLFVSEYASVFSYPICVAALLLLDVTISCIPFYWSVAVVFLSAGFSFYKINVGQNRYPLEIFFFLFIPILSSLLFFFFFYSSSCSSGSFSWLSHTISNMQHHVTCFNISNYLCVFCLCVYVCVFVVAFLAFLPPFQIYH